MPTEEDLRSRLVRAGVELLAREGVAGLTLREIARRAGVSHGAPRRHFPTHRDLLAAIAREGYRALAAEVGAAVAADHPDPYARMLAVANGYLRFAETRPEMFALMFRHDLLQGSAEGLRQASRPLFDTLARLVAEALTRRPEAGSAPPEALSEAPSDPPEALPATLSERPEAPPATLSERPEVPPRPPDPEVVAAALWANLHGLAQLRAWGSLQLVVQAQDVTPVLRAALDAHLRPADRRSGTWPPP
ncbi:TetR/AcrR family transcriptional regulator [Plantactinospora sp. KBS50]|uniref:TetR/AcrR family transcriptional regulator n=1 Tax=Plantactinospora sp. KBS50 TaxID=2024580 RepID=UPI0012FDF71E|nr:TetR/AcrR family transcriptional regulator [Plantactinospora sp. KBS50]